MVDVDCYSYDLGYLRAMKRQFPISGRGKREVVIGLFSNFIQGKQTKLGEVISLMQEKEYLPGRVEELLALVNAHPDLQRELVMAPGSQWRFRNDHVRIPCLVTGQFGFWDTQRSLCFGRKWQGQRWFVGVHRSSVERGRIPIVVTVEHPWSPIWRFFSRWNTWGS